GHDGVVDRVDGERAPESWSGQAGGRERIVEESAPESAQPEHTTAGPVVFRRYGVLRLAAVTKREALGAAGLHYDCDHIEAPAQQRLQVLIVVVVASEQ